MQLFNIFTATDKNPYKITFGNRIFVCCSMLVVSK